MSRHDDAISSLMNEWSQQQGYNNNNDDRTIDDNNDSSNKTQQNHHRRRRLLEELDGYPNNSFLAGNSSIWNPYVQGPNMNIITNNNNNDDGIVISTNPDVEVIRRRCFENFKEECIQSIQRILPSFKKLSIPSILEKWHMDAKHQERQQYKMYRSNNNNNNHKTLSYPIMASTFEINAWTRQQQDDLEQYYYDPVLLSKQSANLLAPYLKEELIRASWKQQPINNNNNKNPSNKMMNKKLNQIQKAMIHAIQTARESYRIQLQQAANQEAIRNNNNNNNTKKKNKNKKKLPKIVQHDNGDDNNNNLVCVIHAGIKFKIHPAYYEKLQRLFDRQQQQQQRSSSSIISFQEALFCMLCRYDMIQGSGLQASIPGSVMDVLLQQFNLNCTMECFASPLNCRYEMYGSAFVELDVLFGSRFNFFDLDNLPSGCYQANPPFCEGIIGALHIQLQKLLSNDHDHDYPLMFIVFVPAWNDSKSYQHLVEKNNEFLTHHFILKAGKHWYAEGTQHRRQGSFRLASFDTSILFYQNDAAKIKWPITTNNSVLEDALKDAFCQNPGSMNKTITTTTTKSPPVLVPRSTSQKQTNDDDDNMKQQQPKTPVDGIVQQQQQVQNEKLATTIAQEDMSGGRASSSSSSTKRKKKKRGVHGGGGGRKKRIFINHEEEKTAQLNVLASLGLTNSSSTTAVNDDDDNNAEDTTTIRQTILPSLGGGEGNDEKVTSFESNNKSKRKRKKKKLVS
eukprot:scaffold10514_cov72-Cylindrotheca_fusiformis.AAC.3